MIITSGDHLRRNTMAATGMSNFAVEQTTSSPSLARGSSPQRWAEMKTLVFLLKQILLLGSVGFVAWLCIGWWRLGWFWAKDTPQSVVSRARHCWSVPDARGNPHSISTPFGGLRVGLDRRSPVGLACGRSLPIREHSVSGYL